jgi:hypothetical protein
MRGKLIWVVPALFVALGLAVVAGCGGGEVSATTVRAAEEGKSPEEAVPDDASETEAITATIKTWLMQGGCDLMTEKFLEAQTFSDDPKAACKTFEAGFAAPSYSEDEIEVGDITYANDKATATVGGGGAAVTSGGEEVTSTFKLVRAGDTWKIASADID